MMRGAIPASQTEGTVRMPLRQLLALMTILGSLGFTAWGLAHSDIVTDIRWSDTMLLQAQLLAGLAAGSTLIAALAERLWRLRMEVGLVLAGGIVVITAFGPLPTAVVAVFLMSATVVGTALWQLANGRSDQPLVLLTVFGVAAYAILFTLLSLFPVNTVWLHAALLGAPLVIAGAVPWLRAGFLARIRLLRLLTALPTRRSLSELLALALLLFVTMLHALIAALLDRYWDAMALHLYLPSFVQGNGAWHYDPALHAFALWPAAVDWMHTHLFLLAGEAGVRLYN